MEEELQVGPIVGTEPTLESTVNPGYVPQEEAPVEVPEVAVRESTMKDYFNILTPGAIQINNPSVGFKVATDFGGGVDTEDPQFKAIFDQADIETKREMLKGLSNSHALKIAEKRDIFRQSAEATSQDPLVMQFVYGAVPAMTDWTTVVSGPVGVAAASSFRVANGASKMSRAVRGLGAGATIGGTAALASEAAFAAEGLQHDYITSTLFGMGFGGTIGTIGGALSGPNGKAIAASIQKEKDSYDFDYSQDPHITLDKSTPITKIGSIDETIIDKIPFVGAWLRSDVNTVYMSKSEALREEMMKVANPTVSLKDTQGNPIPSPTNGMDFKRQTGGVHNKLTLDIDESFSSSREAGYKGSREEFVGEVSKIYVEAAQKQEIEAYKYAQAKVITKADEGLAPEKIEKAFRKELENYYNDNPVVFKTDDSNLMKGADSYRNYYNNMLERGQGVGVRGLETLGKGKVYRPRIYNFKDIHSGKITPEEVTSRVKEALAAHPNQAHLTSDQLGLATQEVVEMLNNNSFDLNFLTSSYIVPKELPFGANLKQRKYKLDETKLGDLLVTNLDDVTGAYHYKMSGRQAVAYSFGTDDIADITAKMRDKMIAEGNTATAKEIQAFERIIKDMVGDLRMNNLSNTPAWTWTRNLSTFNSGRLGGGFGGNQFIELASNVMFSGASHMVSGRFANSFKNTGKLLYTKNKVDDQFTRALVNSGFLSDALHTSRVNRYADTEQGFNTGTLETSLNGVNDKLMKINGMRYFMGAMEDMTGGAIMDQVKVLSKKDLTPTELKRISRWGLTKRDLNSLASDLEKYYDPKAGRLELDKFSQKNQDRFQLAISRGIEEAVIQGDSIHLPNWMKAPSPILKLMTQFMRFPMIANEVLLRRGMTEEQARMGAAVMASTMTYMGLKYAREQASVQLGFVDSADAKYDYFGNFSEEAVQKGVLESLNYNAPLGMMSTLWNAGAVATGNSELGKDYTSNNQAEAFFGPTFGGLVPDMLKITKDISSGDFNEGTANKAKSLVPFNNLPIINEAFRGMIEDQY